MGIVHDDATVQAGLTAVALNSGNTRKAAKALEDADLAHVNQTTLHRWITEQHADEYREIQKRVRNEISADFSEQAERITRSMLDVQEKLVAKVDEDLPNMNGKDAATASKNIGVGFGITNQHKRLERAEPTQISVTQDPYEALKQLATKYGGVMKQALEGEATDITDQPSLPEGTHTPKPGRSHSQHTATDKGHDPHQP